MTERNTEETLAGIAADELHRALDDRGFVVEHVGFDGGNVVASFGDTSTRDGLLYLLEDMGVPFTLVRSRGIRKVTVTHLAAAELTNELKKL